MSGWKKVIFYVCTGIGILGIVVLIVMQVKEPSQAQAANESVETNSQSSSHSNSKQPKVRLEGVAGFDIKGITLGENFTTIKKQFSCTDEQTSSIGNKTWVWRTNCNGATIILDHNEIVNRVMFYKEFSVKPDFQQMLNQVHKKYGNPDLIGLERNNAQGLALISTNCWGSCKSTDANTDYSSGNDVGISTGKGMRMHYYSSDSRASYNFLLQLDDPNSMKKDDAWIGQSTKREQEKRKARESNLSL